MTTDDKHPTSFLTSPAFWLGVAGAATAAGLVYYLRNKEEIDFYIQLYFVRREADKFYARYPRLTKNIVHDPNLQTRLDVYQPDSDGPHPVMVYVYGGSWTIGNKELYAPAAQRLMPHDMVVVVPDYTLFPHATYSQQVTEVASAIAWTLDNIADYGGDPGRVIVCAQSAGAQLAGLALFDEQWLGARSHHVSEIAGFIGISGVYDVEAQYEFGLLVGHDVTLLIREMEGAGNLAAASPVTHVRPGLPPSLLIHAENDIIVPIIEADTFHSALIATGNKSRYALYEGAGHAEILFQAMTENPSRLVRDMVSFVKSCLPVSTGS